MKPFTLEPKNEILQLTHEDKSSTIHIGTQIHRPNSPNKSSTKRGRGKKLDFSLNTTNLEQKKTRSKPIPE